MNYRLFILYQRRNMGDIYFVDDSEYKNPETLALHGGNYRFDPVTSGSHCSDLSQHVLSIQRYRERSKSICASGIRQHLQPDYESNQSCS